MIGRAAMSHPWIFREILQALDGVEGGNEVSEEQKWEFIFRHCREEIAWWGGREPEAMRSMRSRLMAYTRGMRSGARLRAALQRVETLDEVRAIAGEHMAAEC
jgi:tRNA-dihydrouridine synthase